MSYPIQREEFSSQLLGHPCPVVRYGCEGDVWLYLSTSGGDESEAGRYGLDRIATQALQAGRMQLYCVDAQGPATLFNDALEPAEKMRGYARLESHFKEEWIPELLLRHGIERISLLGASYGAFVAANLAFKIPTSLQRVVALGGVYQMWHRLDGFHDQGVYFHTPLEFVPHLHDPHVIESVRASEPWRIFAAQDDPWLESTFQWEGVLRAQQIPFATDVWGSPHGHHESTWRMQWAKALGEIYP